MPQQFTAEDAHAGLTVLAAIRAWLPGESWTKVRHRLRIRQIQVNQVLCLDESRRLKAGDVVSLTDHSLAKPPDESVVRVIYNDAAIAVVEKPPGMLTVRRPEERSWSVEKRALQPTLDEVLLELLRPKMRTPPPGAKQPKRQGPVRVYCVHRLDRDASGLLVFALSNAAAQYLTYQFAAHSVHRIYWAVVPGALPDQTIDTLFVRDRGDGLRGSLIGNPTPVQGEKTADVEQAITHVRTVAKTTAEGNEFSWLQCQLETGRTNQIRIHLAEAGHPICGDIKYRGPCGQLIAETSRAPRLALHATQLGFLHPITEKPMQFESVWPPDLERFLQPFHKK